MNQHIAIPGTAIALFLACAMALVLTKQHIDMIDAPFYQEQRVLHDQVVSHTASSPYQYRVLQPAFVQGLLHMAPVSSAKARKRIFMAGYAAIRWISIVALLFFTYRALATSFSPGISLAGCLFIVFFLPFTYRYYYFQPTSILELACFGIALYAAMTRRPGILVPLALAGTLNRETMVFIPLVYFLYWMPDLKRIEWAHMGAAVLCWAAVFFGLRLLWPASAGLLDIRQYVLANTQVMRQQIDVALIFAPFLAVFLGKALPTRFFRLALFFLPWTALHFFTSQWWEVRYYLPALVCALPALACRFENNLMKFR